MSTCASCGGAIEDGYCTLCGLAPSPSPGWGGGGGPPGRGGGGGGAPRGGGGGGGGGGRGGGGGGGGGAAPHPGGSVSSASRGSRVSGRSGSRRTSGRSARGHLGAGLVEIPPVPYRNPASAIMADPQVPENRRFCGNCEQPVGRGRDGNPGLAEGFCRNCGTKFSFTPKLEPGDLVAGQYEVLGCLAFGGLGWIYLARDHNVSDRWVVLKGLLNTGDADALAAAVAERQFLAQVEHPSIVRIYNFVQYADAGYIVMEYVGGQSLRDIRRAGPVPVTHAIAYGLEVLPALGYLHDRGLVYCDFKPDNVLQSEEQLKLIDLGGVRAIDGDGPIYGTVGYQAPEIADEGPSVASDLYTIARSLAVLTFDFKGFQGQYQFTFPDRVPLLAQQESFARVLRRATHPDPDRRFASAGEMAEQLTGVLREVVAVATGSQRPAFSGLFSPELQAIGTELSQQAPPAADIIAGLPMPQVDRTDPAAGYLATFAGLESGQRAVALLGAITGDSGVPTQVATSPEMKLALARARIESAISGGRGNDGAEEVLAELAAQDPADWRIAWYNGMLALAGGDAMQARGAWDTVCDELAGELAPKLALAFAWETSAEAVGDDRAAAAERTATALRYYRLVWTVDRSYISAAFGLARCLLASSDRAAAIEVLSQVPETSSYYTAAQVAAIRIGVLPGCDPAGLHEAAERLGRLRDLDETRRQWLTSQVLHAALDLVAPADQSAPAQLPVTILGCGPGERSLRFGLERCYRARARLESDRGRRIDLVDMANSVRPRTWI
jgi:serine/threonine-protein kinase PknG